MSDQTSEETLFSLFESSELYSVSRIGADGEYDGIIGRLEAEQSLPERHLNTLECYLEPETETVRSEKEVAAIRDELEVTERTVKKYQKQLEDEGYLKKSGETYRLTEKGLGAARAVFEDVSIFRHSDLNIDGTTMEERLRETGELTREEIVNAVKQDVLEREGYRNITNIIKKAGHDIDVLKYHPLVEHISEDDTFRYLGSEGRI